MPCKNKNGQSTLMAFTRGKVQHFRKAKVYKFVRSQHVDWAWTSISGFQTQVLQYIYVFYISVDVSKGVNKRQTWPVYERPFCFIRRVWFHRLCVGSNFQHGFLQSKTLLLFGIHATPKQTRGSTNQILQFRQGLTSVALISPSLATVLRDRLYF